MGTLPSPDKVNHNALVMSINNIDIVIQTRKGNSLYDHLMNISLLLLCTTKAWNGWKWNGIRLTLDS